MEYDENAPLLHYPSSKYIENNWAPENTLTYGDVAALGKARRQAEDLGVLTPKLGEYMLPIGIREGRSAQGGGGFGILHPDPENPALSTKTGFSVLPSNLARYKRMGLSITDLSNPLVNEATGWKNTPESLGNLQIIRNVNGIKVLQPTKNNDVNSYARMMAAILAEKHAANPIGDVEGTVKLYNGRGRAIEDLGNGKTQQADTDVYWRKVQDAKNMLLHPKNAELLNHFNASYVDQDKEKAIQRRLKYGF